MMVAPVSWACTLGIETDVRIEDGSPLCMLLMPEMSQPLARVTAVPRFPGAAARFDTLERRGLGSASPVEWALIFLDTAVLCLLMKQKFA